MKVKQVTYAFGARYFTAKVGEKHHDNIVTEIRVGEPNQGLIEIELINEYGLPFKNVYSNNVSFLR